MVDTIIERCEASGLRLTEQRRTIAAVLEDADDHPDVEELYARASAVDAGISLATVYRTVKLFEEAGIVEIFDVGQAPIIIVDQTLRSRGLEQYRRRSQPTTSNGIRVELESVPFDEMVLWLGDLSDQFGLHVQAGSLSAIAQAGPGRVNASLTLERSL